MEAKEDSDSQRMGSLDGLRGIAALVVFFSHFSEVIFPSIFNGIPEMSRLKFEWKLAGTPLDLLWAANFSVTIFFVMSAIVLGHYYTREGGHFIAVCVRRYLRLALPILATSFIAYLIWTSGGMLNLKAQEITQEGWLKSMYLTSAPSFTQYLSESLYGVFQASGSQLNSVLWTMWYEILGSLGVFLLYELVPQRTLRVLVLLIAAPFFYNTYFICFIGGLAIYEWVKLRSITRDRLPAFANWALFFAGAYMGAFPYNVATPDNFWFGWMASMGIGIEQWHSYGAILLVFACLNLPTVSAQLCRPLPLYLGKISFALYLIHGILLCSLMSGLIVQFYVPPNRNAAMFLAAAVSVPLIFICAHLIYRYVDRPSIRLSRKAAKWIEASAPLENRHKTP